MPQHETLSAEAVRSGLDTAVVGRQVQFYPEVGSTMDVARDAARNGALEGTVILADVQTAGRGRLGRRWESPPDAGLLLTVILHPPPEFSARLTMAAAVAVVQAIEETTGLRSHLKWPNDVLIDGKKVCGILAENEVRDGALRFSLLGIGTNVNLDPSELHEVLYPATSLAAELGHPVSRIALCRSLLHHLDRWYAELRSGYPIAQAWQARLETVGQRVRVNVGGRVEEGVAEGVDADGSLVLRRDDGSHTTILAGDVTLQV